MTETARRGTRGQARVAQSEAVESFREVRALHRRQQQVMGEVAEFLERGRRTQALTVLVGPTGVGKTTVLDDVRMQLRQRFRELGEPKGQLPYLMVTAVPPQTGVYRWASLYRDILSAGDERFASIYLGGRHRTSDEVQGAAVNALQQRRPGALLIDEAQHITYALRRKPEMLAEHTDNLKWLAGAIPGVPILIAGTYDLLRFILSSAQLSRRTQHVAFLPYDHGVRDMQSFLSAAQTFFNRMPIPVAINPAEEERFLYTGAAGSVGLLKQWCDRALDAAGRSEHVTKKHFEVARMELGKLTRIAKEMRDGQKALDQLNGSELALETALGLEPVTETVPIPHTRRLLPGVRNPVRDPVPAA